MTIWFASGNINKKKELSGILSAEFSSSSAADFDLKIPADAGIDFAPEETGNSFLENALIKAEALYHLIGEPVIADDSGICVDALNGRPGIHSAYYGAPGTVDKSVISKFITQGRKGAKKFETRLPDSERNSLLLSELGDNTLRSARFVCAMVLYYSPNRFFVAQECMEGELVRNMDAAKGTGGFGYDPILYIPELGRTVAELNGEEKNRLSHRGKAGKVISNIIYQHVSHKGAKAQRC